MRRRIAVDGQVLFSLAVLACANPAPQSSTDTGADVQAINAVREREITAFSSGAADSLAAVVTSDAIVMPPNEPVLNGADAVRTWAQNIASQATVSGRYTDSKVTVVGDWAFERYTAVLTLTPKAGGPATEEQIKGVHIYQRQSDGSWRIAQDVWNSDAPAPAPPAAAKDGPA